MRVSFVGIPQAPTPYVLLMTDVLGLSVPRQPMDFQTIVVECYDHFIIRQSPFA
jgi:hypothetical protein